MEFKNATIKQKANVTSRSVITSSGEMKTLGIMLPGVYHFSTETPETIDVLQGHCRVKLADSQAWEDHEEGDSFSIPANSSFEIDVQDLLDYVCHYG